MCLCRGAGGFYTLHRRIARHTRVQIQINGHIEELQRGGTKYDAR